MDHGHMDHGGHGGHDMPGMGGGHKCNMNMLFTWDTTDLCIVFPSWHINGTGTLILSLLAIVLLTAGYEAVREMSRRYDAYAKAALEGRRGADDMSRPTTASADAQRAKIVKAVLYAVQVFYSFFIMLLFMTYNGWVMLAVAVGAFVGYLVFSNSMPSSKTAACH
ncbi:ctr copper transporter family protein [Sporormia fimetaria CBS 119925]|uniref:Copper transport protein n=1 Tax=Sporormia fimetaria CBS 119925 TaxID=1340428 RepID=A0A6A6VJE3_9PLEO|nr:ctr copper transporter family protein [Sporormia fimetaria CBS 119925]